MSVIEDDGIHRNYDHPSGAPNSTQRVKHKIFERDGGKCFWCTKALTLEDATLDHYIARANGGKNAQENLRLSCAHCNQKKAAKDPSNFAKSNEENRRRTQTAEWWQKRRTA